MEEKNIYLSDLGDEDLVAIQSSFYKSVKLIETARWQSAILRFKFAFETEINGDREIENITNPSPLDEIRNSNIQFL